LYKTHNLSAEHFDVLVKSISDLRVAKMVAVDRFSALFVVDAKNQHAMRPDIAR
jgi:hypothetical protein